MSGWSRADDDVKLAVTTWRLAADGGCEHLNDSGPIGRAEIIADMRRGFEAADMIVQDMKVCRAGRRRDPLRWAIGTTKEVNKRSMLAAQIDELGRLLDGLGPRAGRTLILETSAIYASLVSDLKLKQDEERRFLISHREELKALRRQIAIIKKLLAEIRGGRLDECDAREPRPHIIERLTEL